MNKNRCFLLESLLLILILIIASFTGCVEEQQKEEIAEEEPLEETPVDQVSMLPNWRDGVYHDYQETERKLRYYNDKFPNLVEFFSIGKRLKRGADSALPG